MSCRREPSNGLLISWMSEESDPRLYHAHVARNREPIDWARKNGHAPHVARVRHLNDKKNPDHWRVA
jgi:hypothetical protein